MSDDQLPAETGRCDEGALRDADVPGQRYALIALWMVCLIILLPIESAAALGALSVQTFSGRDGVRGIARSYDTLTVEALVSLSDDALITRDQFHVKAEDIDFVATSCTLESGTQHKCTFTQDVIGGYGVVPYRFELRRDNGGVAEQKTEELRIDGQGAEIVEIKAKQRVRSRDVKIGYIADDALGAPTCAGIERVELYIGGVAGKPVATRQGSRACREEGEFTQITFSKAGAREVCIVAIDRLNLSGGPNCVTLDVDDGPPKIQSLSVTDEFGNVYKYISSGGIIADIRVSIDGPDVLIPSIKANLTGASKNSRDRDVPPTEVVGDTVKVAIWRGVTIPTPSACQVTVSAEDDVGNSISKTLGCGLQLDNSAPRLEGIVSSVDINGTPAISGNDLIAAVISESGSGLSHGRVYLDASSVGLSDALPAENCTQRDSAWLCFWHIKPMRGGNAQFTLDPSSRDDAGNLFDLESLTLHTVIVDAAPPTNISIVNVRILHGTTDIGDVAVRGDLVEYKVKAQHYDIAYADFSQLGGLNVSPCESQEGDVCTFTTPIDVSGPLVARSRFHFFDVVGNNATLTHNLTVLGIQDDPNPNFWTNTVTCSPSLVDRSTTALINTRVYCAVKLRSQAGAKTLAIGLDTNNCNGSISGIADLGISNNHAGSTDPILYVLLGAQDFNVNSISFTCPLKILSRTNDYVTLNPETEKVRVVINFFSLPQPDLEKALTKKFDDAKKSALKLDGLIGTLKKLFTVAEKICQIRSAILSALNAIDSVLALVDYIKAGMEIQKEIADAGVTQACIEFVTAIGPELQAMKAQAKAAAEQRVPDSKARATPNAAEQTVPQKIISSEAGVAGSTPPTLGELASSAASNVGTAVGSIGEQVAGLGKSLYSGLANIVPKGDVGQLSGKIASINKAVDEGNTKKAVGVWNTITAEEKALMMKAMASSNLCLATTNPTTGTCNTLPPPIGLGVSTPPRAIGCLQQIPKLQNLQKAMDKLEDARQKICGQKQDLVKKFTDNIDKYAKPFCDFVNCQSGPVGKDAGLFGKVLSSLGGGLPTNPNTFIQAATGISPQIGVKDSLVWSVASLCIPGIINNVDKYRQIECQYALCVGKEVVEKGLPISACEKKKEELMCQFLWSQVFNAVPFVGVLEGWVNTLKDIVTNPIAALTFLLGQYCKGFCDKDKSKISSNQYKICAFPKTLEALAAVINDIKAILTPDFWKLGSGACDELKDYEPGKPKEEKKGLFG